jgi:hypothetical protein
MTQSLSKRSGDASRQTNLEKLISPKILILYKETKTPERGGWFTCLRFIKHLLFLFFLVILEFELRASRLLGRHLSQSTSPVFLLGIFEIGLFKLFAWAGFEPQSS